ncbi:MAG TPA: LysE family transporter [Aliidongia sp.]|nr:LysE family transporter [Aliidongia sp.]
MEALAAFLPPGMGRPLATLILASMVVMGSPGPSTISMTAVGASFGVRRSLGYASGLIVGTIAVLLMVAMGVMALVTSIPYGALVLGGVSAVYIAFLAFKIATAPPLDNQGGRTAAPTFLGGVLLAIANPKAYLAIAAVFAGTTVIADDHGLDAIVKTALLSAMIVAIHICWLMAGAGLSRVLQDPVSSRVINLALAAVLVIMTGLAVFG